jgi:hypothetical protein
MSDPKVLTIALLVLKIALFGLAVIFRFWKDTVTTVSSVAMILLAIAFCWLSVTSSIQSERLTGYLFIGLFFFLLLVSTVGKILSKKEDPKKPNKPKSE